jgi:hypothetical protein
MIYIQEAHPIDGWWLGKGPISWLLKLKGTKAVFDVYDPQSAQERRQVAKRCFDTLAFDIPTLLDGMDNAVNVAYAAWPTRLYLIGLDGRVEYAAGLGPWGFKPAELEQEIQRYLQLLPEA